MKNLARRSAAWLLALVLVCTGVIGTSFAYAETQALQPQEGVEQTSESAETQEPQPQEAAVPVANEPEDEQQKHNEAGAGYFSITLANEDGTPISMQGPNDEATFALLSSPDRPARDHFVMGYEHFGFWSYKDAEDEDALAGDSAYEDDAHVLAGDSTDEDDAHALTGDSADKGAEALAENIGQAITVGPVPAGTYWLILKTSPAGHELPVENVFQIEVTAENTAQSPVAITVTYPEFSREVKPTDPNAQVQEGGISPLAVYTYYVARASGSPIGSLADGTPVWLHTITPPGTDTDTGGTIAYCASHGAANPNWSRYNPAGGASQGAILSAIVGNNSSDYVSQQGAYWIALGQYAYGLDAGADAMYDAAVTASNGGGGGSGSMPDVSYQGNTASNNSTHRPVATINVGGDWYSRFGPFESPAATRIAATNLSGGAFYGDAAGNILSNSNLPGTFYVYIPAKQVLSSNVSFSLTLSYPRAVPGTSTAYTPAGSGSQTLATATGSQYDPTGNSGIVAFELEQYRHGLIVVDKRDGDRTRAGLKGATWQIYEWNGTGWQLTDYQMNWAEEFRTYTSDMLWETSWNGGRFRVVEVDAPYAYAEGASLASHEFTLPPLGNLESLTVQTLYDAPVYSELSIRKHDRNTNLTQPQGDASLEGAVYGLYIREQILHPSGKVYEVDEQVATGTTDPDGKITFSMKSEYDYPAEKLFPAKYYVKEIAPSTGYLLDDTEYDVDLTVSDADPSPVIIVDFPVTEQVKKQGFKLRKTATQGDETEIYPLENAGFSVYLISELTKVADGTLTKPIGGFTAGAFKTYFYDYGSERWDFSGEQRARIDDVVSAEYFTNADGEIVFPEFPYGVYIVVETTVPYGYDTMNPIIVRVEEDAGEIDASRPTQQWRYGIDYDNFYIRITKRDAETESRVLNNSAAYRIFDLTNNVYVTQTVSYPVVETIGTAENPFRTDAEGRLILPKRLTSGEYKIIEASAPTGYTKLYEEQTDFEGYYDAATNGDPYHEHGYGSDLGEHYTLYSPPEDIIQKTPQGDVGIYFNFADSHRVDELDANIIDIEVYNRQQKGHINIHKEKEPGESDAYIDDDALISHPYPTVPMEGVKFKLFAAADIYSQDGQGTLLYAAGSEIPVYAHPDGYLTATKPSLSGGGSGSDTPVTFIVTDADGNASVQDLYLGRYVLREIDVDGDDKPLINGHTLSGYRFVDEIFFDLEAPGRDEHLQVPGSVWNQKQGYIYASWNLLDIYELGRVDLHKEGEQPGAPYYDSETGNLKFPYEEEPLEGAVFEIIAKKDIKDVNTDEVIWREGDVVSRITTDEDGNAHADNLLPGEYTLREVDAPEGYLFVPDEDFEIGLRSHEEDFSWRTWDLIDVRQKLSIVLEKTDEGSGALLPGAEFTLFAKADIQVKAAAFGGIEPAGILENLRDFFTGTLQKLGLAPQGGVPHDPADLIAAGEAIQTARTGADGKAYFTDLPPGSYTIKETKAPPLYQISDKELDVTLSYGGRDAEYLTWTGTVTNSLSITCEVDKDTIKRTSAAFVSLPGQVGLNNVGKADEMYRYDIDFRSTSSVWADEFVVDDPLEGAKMGLVRVEALYTPVVWGDTDGLWNLWYATNKTDLNKDYTQGISATVLTDEHPEAAYPNFVPGVLSLKPWPGGQMLETTRQYVFKASDLGLADGEYLTHIRFEYGKVEVGFTSKNYGHLSLNGEHRPATHTLPDIPSEAAKNLDIAPLLAFAAEDGTPSLRLSAFAVVSPLANGLGQSSERVAMIPGAQAPDYTGGSARSSGGISGDRIDWTPNPAEVFYPKSASAAAELTSAALLPASYLVSAAKAMQTEDIVSSVSAKIARADMRDYDIDAVLTRELPTFAAGSGSERDGSAEVARNSYAQNLKNAAAAKTADEFALHIWIIEALISAALLVILSVTVIRRRRVGKEA